MLSKIENDIRYLSTVDRISSFGKKIKEKKSNGQPRMTANQFDKTGYHTMKGRDGRYYTITPAGETHGRDVRWRWIPLRKGEKPTRLYN